MPDEGINFVPHEDVLSYEEMLRLVEVSVHAGIRKVRLTGGEPLVRKGFVDFLDKLSSNEVLDEITLTTNGVLLPDFAADIKECGICRINISLDTLKPERFLQITRRDYFEKVIQGIQEAERLGFDPIKINVVAIRGFNDDEILDFARMTLDKPYHIRFIEYMPVGDRNSWSNDKFISTGEIRDKILEVGGLQPIPSSSIDGPAERYRLEGGKGEIGFIGALSNHFCDRCNRLRLTSEGHLRGCLFSDKEIDVKAPLREGKSDNHLIRLINRAIETKPKSHEGMSPERRKCVRHMSSIGG
jgi:cyclic pyranopterin phosphate synthase